MFCLDAFHYLSSKKAVVAELRRIATARALWLFPHLHNRLQPNLVAGIPLSPEHYLECFGFPEARLFDETELLRGLTQEHVLNLECSPSVDQLNAAQTLTFIHGGGELWRKHNGFPSALCRNPAQLEINPIYQQRQCSDGLELERSWPNDTLRDECRAAEEILPARCRLNRDDLNLLNAGVKPRGGHPAPAIPRLQELVSRFVLVPLPPRYA